MINTYRRHKRENYVAHVQKHTEGAKYTEALNQIRSPEHPQLNRAHRKAISRRGGKSLEELIEQYEQGQQ